MVANLERQPTVYDATHGFSDQYIEKPVLHKLAAEQVYPDLQYFKQFRIQIL
jgi:hypothetical protein